MEGRPYFDWAIFRVKFDFPPGLLRAARRGSGPAMKAVDDAMRNTVQEILKKLEQVLSKEYKFKVGATERASQNFLYTFSGSSKMPTAEIMEGTMTPANFFIRRGSTGHGIPPPIENIREWMMAKRDVLQFQYVNKRKEPKKVRFTKGGSVYSNQERGFEEILHRIRWTIAHEGTSKASESRPPVGSRYFDYLKWVASQKYIYERLLKRSDALARLFVNFMLAGEKVEFEDFDRSRGFRFRTFD